MIKKFLRWLILLVFSENEKKYLAKTLIKKYFDDTDNKEFAKDWFESASSDSVRISAVEYILSFYPIKYETNKLKKDLILLVLGTHVSKIIKQDLVTLAFDRDESIEFRESLLVAAFNELYHGEILDENRKIKEGKYGNSTLVPCNQFVFKNFNEFLYFGDNLQFKSMCNYDREFQVCTQKIRLTKASVRKLILGGDIYLHIPKVQFTTLMRFGMSVGLEEDEIFTYDQKLIEPPNTII